MVDGDFKNSSGDKSRGDKSRTRKVLSFSGLFDFAGSQCAHPQACYHLITANRMCLRSLVVLS